MPSTVKTKKKRPSTLSHHKNMNAVMALSDLLKLAGIKEYKPQSGVKSPNLHRSFKKRKSTFKIKPGEKHQNLPAEFTLKEPNKKRTLKGKNTILENSSHSSPESSNNKKNHAEETLYASLDFIKDCRKYKKKMSTTKEDLQLNNQEENKAKGFSTECKQYYAKKADSQHLSNDYPLSRVIKDKELKSSCENKDFLFHNNKLGAKETAGDELKSSVDEISAVLKTDSFIHKLSLGDVARIDKKYLESVLSLANSPEPCKKKNLEKGEIGKERTKKSNGKTFQNSEVELTVDYFKNEERPSFNKSSRAQSRRDQNSTRIVRDSTKSEVRIQLRDKKKIGNLRNSEEIKIEKEIIHSKAELNDGRKKRKLRNKILKSSNKEGIEIPFSSEVSKAKDVKELWRRETQKKSENSLTSHSSCTIPENDENSKWTNLGLQSYRILHKLVEEEINKISQKSENKNNKTEMKNQDNATPQVHENKAGNIKETQKSKNVFNKLKLPTDENLIEKKEALLVKKKLMMAENLQNYSTYEGEKNKTELLRIFDEKSVKPTKEELKLPEEKGKKCSKVPDPKIENWSILNRLEQAFLALGTSNFQSENSLKTKQGSKNNSTQNCEVISKISKEKKERKKKKSQNQTSHGPPSNRKILKSPPKPKLNNNEPASSKKKTEDVKPPSATNPSVQPKEKNKQNEPCKTENKNAVGQNENAKQPLMRKKTFNVISLKEPSVTQSQNSNASSKTDDILKSDKLQKRPTQTAKQEPQTREKGVEKNNKPISRSKSNEKREVKTRIATPKNQVKPVANEKTLQSHENFKSGIPKPRIITQKQKCERTVPAEGSLQQASEKQLNQKTSNERPVKERSILSMLRNKQERQPSSEKFHPIQEKSSSSFSPSLKSSTGDLLLKNAQKNFEDLCQKPNFEPKNNNSNIYYICADPNLENILNKNFKIKIVNFPKQMLSENGEKLTAATTSSQSELSQQNIALDRNPKEFSNSKYLSLWERDIHRYQEIVKDIMSQYKRIDGFLKQSESLGLSSNKSELEVSSKKLLNEKSSKFYNDSQAISLEEYRKKIMTEYQTLPFFEYKQLKKDENNKLEGSRKRNLSVVSNVNKEMDFDVKDYQPKIKKVLDSQLYVDREGSEEKLRNKNSSLQEMSPLDRRIGVFKKNCLKKYSLPKTFLLPDREVYSVQSNNQRLI